MLPQEARKWTTQDLRSKGRQEALIPRSNQESLQEQPWIEGSASKQKRRASVKESSCMMSTSQTWTTNLKIGYFKYKQKNPSCHNGFRSKSSPSVNVDTNDVQGSRFSTPCHQPDGKYSISPGLIVHSCSWAKLLSSRIGYCRCTHCSIEWSGSKGGAPVWGVKNHRFLP